MIGSGRVPMRWANVLPALLRQSYHRDFEVEKSSIEHPANAGFRQSLGELKGQDWRQTLPDGSCAHVLEYPTSYVYHRDIRNPDTDPWGHLLEDAPHWLFVIALVTVGVIILVVAALASWIGERRD
jgi:hypothetical protein